MKRIKTAIALLFLLVPVTGLGLVACDDDGVAEETGEQIDDAADEVEEEF